MKIIPAIDLMDGQVVRLFKGDPNNKTVYSNNPQEVAKKWENAGADMIHLVDLDATLQRGSNFEIIKQIVKAASIPIQVAGGLRSKKIIEESLEFAQRIVVGTIAFNDVALLMDVAEKFGKDRIVLSVDHNDGLVVINGWQTSTSVRLDDAIRDFVAKSFTEFLVTNVSRDGTLQGPDLKNLQTVCSVSRINVIASGGISQPSDIPKVKESGAYGVILGKALYDGKISIEEAKKLA